MVRRNEPGRDQRVRRMMRWLRFLDWPLRAKMAAFLVVASLLPLTVATVIDIRQMREQLAAGAGALLAARADELAGRLDSFNGGYQLLVDKLARLPGMPALPLAGPVDGDGLRPAVRAILDLQVAREPGLRAIGVLDGAGRVHTATEDRLVGTDLSRLDGVRRALRGESVTTGIEVLEPLFGEVPTITYLAAVHGPDGRQVGTVALWVRAAALWEVAKASNNLAGADSFAVLVDQHGIRIAHSYSDDIVFHPTGRLDPGLIDGLVAEQRFGTRTRELLEDVRPFPEQFARATADTADTALFEGFAPVNGKMNHGVGRRLGSAPWTLFYMIPQATVGVQTTRMALQKALFATFIMIAALVIGMLVAEVILTPLRALTRATQVIADGDLAARVPIDRADELGRLSQRFNTMAERIGIQTREVEHTRDVLEQRVRTRTADLLHSMEDLELEIGERKQAEVLLQAQLARLDLLGRIARAIGERQDLESIHQVVVRSLEEHLPVDLCCACQFDPTARILTVSTVGARGAVRAAGLGLTVASTITADENGFAHCIAGQLVYEPDTGGMPSAFHRRLADGGLRALVAVPLRVDDQTFGMLLVARAGARSFSGGECEFLQQLSELVALAAHHSRLYTILERAYDDLRQSQQAVMQHERLRVMGQMASGIAHDINNAISPAMLYTESLMEREQGLSPRARAQLATILQAIGDVARTVGRMREFYRHEDAQARPLAVDPNSLVGEALELTRAVWHDGPQARGVAITIRSELADGLPTVPGVAQEIREALVNLIGNAVEAMPGGGMLTVTTRLDDGAGGRRVQVVVGDTGTGMDERTRRRCLEPFFTTKGEGRTGLGLAMVYGMTQRHRAEIEIDSVVGRGTTVRLDFPASAAPVAADAPTPAPSPRPARHLRILVVDDDAILLQSLDDTLKDEGHTVTTANHGQAAIDLLRAGRDAAAGPAFDLVITDLGMPDVDGRQVAQAVKELSPATPVILLTGWGQRLMAEGELPPHVDCVLGKPPKMGDLRAAIARYGAARSTDPA